MRMAQGKSQRSFHCSGAGETAPMAAAGRVGNGAACAGGNAERTRRNRI